VEVVFVAGDADRKKIGLDGGDAVQAPGGVTQRLNKVLFERSDGPELLQESLGMALVCGRILGREDDGLAGETVAEGEEAGALFAGAGAGAGGFFGVGAVDGGAIGIAVVAVGAQGSVRNIRHEEVSLLRVNTRGGGRKRVEVRKLLKGQERR
jgi:hypothetical protein